MMNELLERLGVKYEDLDKAERDTLHKMLDGASKAKVTVDTIRVHIKSMRDAVENEIYNDSMKRPSFWAFLFRFRRECVLKARLRNYMLLEAYLDTPERAKKAIEDALANVKRKEL